MGCGGFRIEEIGCPRGGGFGGEQMAQGGQGWSGATPATELRAARPLHSRTGTVGSDPCPSSSERAVTLPSQRLEVSHLDMGGGCLNAPVCSPRAVGWGPGLPPRSPAEPGFPVLPHGGEGGCHQVHPDTPLEVSLGPAVG